MIRATRRGPVHLSASEHAARCDASAIVEQARADAAELRKRAVAQGEAIGRAQVAADLAAIAQLRARAIDEAEAAAVQAVLMICKQLIGEGFAEDPGRVGQLLAPLLSRVRSAQRIVVRLHPADRENLYASHETDQGAAWLRKLGVAGEVDLVADPAVTRGGCVVESSFGSLDARVETRLAELARALRSPAP